MSVTPTWSRLRLYEQTESYNTNSGTLIVEGGAAIVKNLHVGGSIYANGVQITGLLDGPGDTYFPGTNLNLINETFNIIPSPTFSGIVTLTSTQGSSSTTNGSLVVYGGVGISGNLHGATIYSNGNRVATVGELAPLYYAGDNLVMTNTTFNVSQTPEFEGVVTMTSTATSVSKTTGALVVTGGIGVSGNIYASQLFSNGERLATVNEIMSSSTYSAGTNMVLVNGVFHTVNNPSFTGIVTVSSTATSSSKLNGALVVAGGIGVSGDTYGSNFYSNGVRLARTDEVPTAGTNISITSNTLRVVPNPTFSGIVTLTSTVVSTGITNGALVITGGLGVSGTVNANVVYATTLTGAISTAAQPNVTSIGTLTGLTSAGIVSVTSTVVSTSKTDGALVVTGGLGVSGDTYGNNFYSNGVRLATVSEVSNSTTSFSAANNVVTPANVTDVINTGPTFTYQIKCVIDATVQSTSLYTIIGTIQQDGSYITDLEEMGPIQQNLYFSVLPSGQLQYISPSFPGWVSTTFTVVRK